LLNLDFSGLGDFQEFSDIGAALELHMLGRLVDGPSAKQLQEFGRNGHSVGLARAREVFDAAVRDAEHDLRQKWPAGNLKVRFISASLVMPIYQEGAPDEPDLLPFTQRLDKDYLPEFLSSLADSYPEDAKDLPDAENLRIGAAEEEDAQTSPDAAIEITGYLQVSTTNKRPAGEFKNAEQLEQARLRTDPYKATFRIAYEVVAEQDNRRNPPREPVLAVEVVTLSFEFRGERWELIEEKKEKSEDAR